MHLDSERVVGRPLRVGVGKLVELGEWLLLGEVCLDHCVPGAEAALEAHALDLRLYAPLQIPDFQQWAHFRGQLGDQRHNTRLTVLTLRIHCGISG